jgi:uncharacterized repeat protein (TIGR03803 family)
MAYLRRLRNLTPGAGVATVTLALAIMFVLAAAASQPAQAQTFNVLHTFTGGNDGGNPSAGVINKAGDLYGTTYAGGAGYGTVYQLKHRGSSWTINPLHSFTGSEGAIPSAPVSFGPDGALYSTTEFGGTTGNGNVFKMRPSPTACKTALCPWSVDVLYDFEGGTDGSKPIGLVFDHAGNIYGTTSAGGAFGRGAAYELTSSGNGSAESILHSFGSGADGITPYRSVLAFDNAGNMYGTTMDGGLTNAGTVFQMTPSGSGWIESVIYSFQGGSDGRFPYAGLIIDQAGNLYGATTDAGTGGGGTVFELSPSGGGWTYSVLYSLTGSLGQSCGPAWALVTDTAGNLYDTTECGGANGLGNVFKLTKTGGSWTYTSLHDFTGGNDGSFPLSGVLLDTSDNLYGTTFYGGSNNYGVIWEVTP